MGSSTSTRVVRPNPARVAQPPGWDESRTAQSTSGWNTFPVSRLSNSSGQDASPLPASKMTGMDAADPLPAAGATWEGSQNTALVACIHARRRICMLHGKLYLRLAHSFVVVNF